MVYILPFLSYKIWFNIYLKCCLNEANKITHFWYVHIIVVILVESYIIFCIIMCLLKIRSIQQKPGRGIKKPEQYLQVFLSHQGVPPSLGDPVWCRQDTSDYVSGRTHLLPYDGHHDGDIRRRNMVNRKLQVLLTGGPSAPPRPARPCFPEGPYGWDRQSEREREREREREI